MPWCNKLSFVPNYKAFRACLAMLVVDQILYNLWSVLLSLFSTPQTSHSHPTIILIIFHCSGWIQFICIAPYEYACQPLIQLWFVFLIAGNREDVHPMDIVCQIVWAPQQCGERKSNLRESHFCRIQVRRRLGKCLVWVCRDGDAKEKLQECPESAETRHRCTSQSWSQTGDIASLSNESLAKLLHPTLTHAIYEFRCSEY